MKFQHYFAFLDFVLQYRGDWALQYHAVCLAEKLESEGDQVF